MGFTQSFTENYRGTPSLIYYFALQNIVLSSYAFAKDVSFLAPIEAVAMQKRKAGKTIPRKPKPLAPKNKENEI